MLASFAGKSFEEKSAWVTLLAMLAVWGLYSVIAWRMLVAGVTTTVAFMPVFAIATVLLVALLVAGHVAVALLSRPEGRDERDRLIEWRAESRSSWILGAGVLGAIFALALAVEPAWVANGLLMVLFLSEVAKLALQLVDYQRGF